MKRYRTLTKIITVVGLVLFVSITIPLVLIAASGWADIYVDNPLSIIFAMSKFLSAVSILVLILIILVCIVANRFFGKSYRLKIPLILLIVMTALYLALIPIIDFFPTGSIGNIRDMPPLQLPPGVQIMPNTKH